LHITRNLDGTYTFDWNAFTNLPFDYYKLVFEDSGSSQDPSYPGSHYWAVPATSDTTAKLAVGPGTSGANGGNADLVPGTYKVRIQAVGSPGGSLYIYGQTTIVTVTIS
jgi:hypothetical protein